MPKTRSNKLEWNDLNVILAIGRAGSLLGASKSLGQDHSTVFRRINAIEKKAGVRFFDRHAGGYQPTESGEIACRYAERIEGEFDGLNLEVLGRDAHFSGSVLITAPEGVATTLLPAPLKAFHERYPLVEIELIDSFQNLDLGRREADVAIRMTNAPPEDAIGYKLSDFRIAIYASTEYSKKAPDRPIAELPWIFIPAYKPFVFPNLWKNQACANEYIVLRTNSFIAGANAAAAGMGVIMLPCYRGDCDKRLVRLTPPLDWINWEVWILTHSELRNTARVKALMYYLREQFRAHQDLFAGRAYSGPEPLFSV